MLTKQRMVTKMIELQRKSTVVSELGEREIIRKYIAPLLSIEPGGPLLDDCAVFSANQNEKLLLSVDQGPSRTFLETLAVGTPADVGHLHVTLNVSDIAAMGGEPAAMLMVMALTGNESILWLEQFLTGVSDAMRDYNVSLIGGDTKQSKTRSTSITIIGKARGKLLTRTGAADGDQIFVTPGTIGDILKNYVDVALSDIPGALPKRPMAQIKFGLALSNEGIATSCMDMSDGLLASVDQLGRANQLEYILDIPSIPLSKPPNQYGKTQWQNLILNVGGDFGLVFTTSKSDAHRAIELGALRIGEVRYTGISGVDKISLERAGIFLRAWEQFLTTDKIADEIRSIVS